ncbi:hypothetical protein [uncultured Maribacter sp.]|uniref:hypothetical protein n=1 Tax=uncultured Maribacter sp. TaxID=431308 RepID=UPI0026091263|nr:hypothetical protein [uncultured Maribacter sp.]
MASTLVGLLQGLIHQKAFFTMYAVEGLIWLDRNYFKNMLHKQRRKTLNKLLKITEQDINVMSFSPHMMIAARKKY